MIPIQPIIKDKDGILRFKENKIAVWLVTELGETGKQHFSNEDKTQFAMLLGCSLSEFGNLSYVSDELWKIICNIVEECGM